MPKTDKSEQRSTKKSKKKDNKGFPYKTHREKEFSLRERGVLVIERL